MIRGIGVDIVDLARFERQVERTPGLVPRLFTESERGLPIHSLAARFASKEAFVKALGDSQAITWQELEVVTDGHGNPGFVLHGSALAALADRGISGVHLTMTHDAGVACAFVVMEGP
ncbi:holo-[acyl-carrier protein] synthase [Cryobacterium psychrotolerans]|uniref:Holo-[acyl-carrier-protein] synthase n=1 Tax=Cryobacterium psychrotolerans TaxID=386301 RepID=A0A1G9AK73_9MICO|nr:holo-ACP synthase [Cryobacterium psychrotolerans]TFD89625.1 holo-ACP synthase [Cryobacterium psychrotolerans]SDK27752.1 holo-[acyl-carrier protein] synthase [Cryobacterium psychrotolerans]